MRSTSKGQPLFRLGHRGEDDQFGRSIARLRKTAHGQAVSPASAVRSAGRARRRSWTRLDADVARSQMWRPAPERIASLRFAPPVRAGSCRRRRHRGVVNRCEAAEGDHPVPALASSKTSRGGRSWPARYLWPAPLACCRSSSYDAETRSGGKRARARRERLEPPSPWRRLAGETKAARWGRTACSPRLRPTGPFVSRVFPGARRAFGP